MILECCIKSNSELLLTTKWAGNGAIIPSISHYVQLERIAHSFCRWSVSTSEKMWWTDSLKTLGRIIFQLKKGQAWISIFSPGGSATPRGERIASHRVKASSAACKNGRCSCCWISSGWHRRVALWDPGPREDNGQAVRSGRCGVRVTGPLFSGLHRRSDCLVTTHRKEVVWRIMVGEGLSLWVVSKAGPSITCKCSPYWKLTPHRQYFTKKIMFKIKN